LDSKTLKRLRGETGAISKLELRKRLVGLTVWQAPGGKKATLALCAELIIESLERQVDEAFGVTRTLTEAKRNPEPTSSRTRTGCPTGVLG